MPDIDDIPIAREGELPSAAGHNAMRELLGRTASGAAVLVDSTGAHHRRQPSVDSRLEGYVELYEALAPGGTAQAYPRSWNGTAYVTDLTADTFAVVDVLKQWRGRGRDGTASAEDDSGGTRGKHGSFGHVVARNGQWELDDLSPHATGITCQVNDSSYASGDIDVDTVVVTKPVKIALLMDDVTSVVNRHWDADTVDDDDPITAEWDDVLEKMAAIQEDC